MDARARTLANHEIDAKIFHCRIKHFFNRGLIDQFIAKQTPDISRRLIEAVERLLETPNARHAQTWRVTLGPAQKGRLRLAIEDNGIGFDAAPEENIGVRLIRTFAQQIGGLLTFSSRSGKGTRIELLFADPARTAAPGPETESGPLIQAN